MILGDFSNVLSVANRIGGNLVEMIEFEDLETMMADAKLFSMRLEIHILLGLICMHIEIFTLGLIGLFVIGLGF